MNDLIHLPETVVENEKVISKILFSDEIYSFGRLIVLPHSKIRLHKHETDCEWYLNELTNELFYCPQVELHEFEMIQTM